MQRFEEGKRLCRDRRLSQLVKSLSRCLAPTFPQAPVKRADAAGVARPGIAPLADGTSRTRPKTFAQWRLPREAEDRFAESSIIARSEEPCTLAVDQDLFYIGLVRCHDRPAPDRRAACG